MGYLLKEALKTLCGVNRWSYAVFWKICCQNPRLLVWEECYHESGSGSGFFSENAFREFRDGGSVHLLVNKMMLNHHVVVLGEGLIGRAAFTGDYQWILSEKFYTQNHPPEVQKELFQQFSGGMQTVAVIPVLPHGVIQFGSPLTITESVEFMNEVATLILHLGCVSTGLIPENYARKEHSVSLDSEGFDAMNCFLYSDHSSLADVPLSNEFLPNVASFSRCDQYANPVPEVKLECSSSNRMIRSSEAWTDSGLIYSSADDTFGGVPVEIFGCGPSSSKTVSPIGSSDFIIKQESAWNSVNSEQSSFLSNGSSPKLEDQFFSGFDDPFAQTGYGDDLFDVLGADFKNKLLSGSWNSDTSLKNESVSMMEYSSSIEVSKAHKECSDTGILSMPSVVPKVQTSPVTKMDVTASCKTTTSSSFATESSFVYGAQLISWVENNHKAKQSNSVSTGCSTKPHEMGKTPRKRLKPGENPRPRPKDRQMIQDRVKELREIVPNGAKCSIDALLERTIKHMLFLQSVMKHADKLKQSGESKIISKNGSHFEPGGATWAYEVGSHSLVPPIVVENLHQPRQMRVEMLCEERGLFLEIADVIRGLGLTILRGVMETRNDKIWARFVVEANREITRMEIFISLVRLLEQGAAKTAEPAKT